MSQRNAGGRALASPVTFSSKALPRPSNVVPFLGVLIRFLTKKLYQTQKGTTLEGPGKKYRFYPRQEKRLRDIQTALMVTLSVGVHIWGGCQN